MRNKIKILKIDCANRILKQYKTYKFRKGVLKKLGTLKKKIIWLRKLSKRNYRDNLKLGFQRFWGNCLGER